MTNGENKGAFNERKKKNRGIFSFSHISFRIRYADPGGGIRDLAAEGNCSVLLSGWRQELETV